MAVFDSIIGVAARLLEKFGEKSKLVRTTPGAPSDPTKDWEPGAPTTSTTDVFTVWLNESLLRKGTLAKEGQAFAIMAGKGLTVTPDPTLDVLVRADGRRFAIERADPLDPNGQKIIFEVLAKR